ncbi:chorismate-binding protein [uncultured Polaribacter sp.]|uniref:chorismate-binding protein n=1 Tax=uncultured Polaribacter sp. TaxID=174711 RepID=UPI00261E6302|nr:chorismate-binding protein [uncultured Polaribacter sp.]
MKIIETNIESHYKSNLPFVVYNKPNSNTVSSYFMKDDALSYTTSFKEEGFVFAPYDVKEKAILFASEKADFIEDTILLAPNLALKEDFEEVVTGKNKHLQLVERAIKEIQLTFLKKVIVSRKEVKNVSNFNVLNIFKKLLKAYPTAFVYVWFHPKVGLWFGATPETLLAISEANFKTMSLAGTQLNTNTVPVVWKSKELEEQQLVTDFIENELKEVASNLIVNKKETVKAGGLLHLKTVISGVLNKNATLKELINSLHPTPAICGLPRANAMSFISKHENYNRTFYTGFLGELNKKEPQLKTVNSQLYVNLRCMSVENNEVSIYVGGGITKDSNAEKEWQETVSKSMTIKKVL